MKIDLQEEIVLPEGVNVDLNGAIINVKGPNGEIKKTFTHPRVSIVVDAGKIILSSSKATKKEKVMVGTFTAHIKNMIKGVQEPFVYKLKICSGHFPMTVSVSGNEVIIKNFLGESVPRKVTLLDGSEVKVNGTEIVITSPDKEVAGQNAAKIESLCRITNRDIRIFQDGCYIVHKAGKDIS